MCDDCKRLLSEGLDLCVRARKLDAQDRATAAVEVGVSDLDRYAEHHNALWPDQPVATCCGTIALWVQDQYEKDLADWERRSRWRLTQGCGWRPASEG